MRQTILVFGGIATLLLVLFRVSRYSVLTDDLRAEITIGVTAVVFLVLGFLFRRRENKANAEAPSVQRSGAATGPLPALTGREQEVLEHIAAGLSNQEIAASLHLSESTIKTHVSNLLGKLGARRRTQAVHRARERGLLG